MKLYCLLLLLAAALTLSPAAEAVEISTTQLRAALRDSWKIYSDYVKSDHSHAAEVRVDATVYNKLENHGVPFLLKICHVNHRPQFTRVDAAAGFVTTLVSCRIPPVFAVSRATEQEVSGMFLNADLFLDARYNGFHSPSSVRMDGIPNHVTGAENVLLFRWDGVTHSNTIAFEFSYYYHTAPPVGLAPSRLSPPAGPAPPPPAALSLSHLLHKAELVQKLLDLLELE